jgi:predicted MFS family arabinose efflux permease
MSLFVAAFNIGTILAQFGLGLAVVRVGLPGIFLIAGSLVLLAIPCALSAVGPPAGMRSQ